MGRLFVVTAIPAEGVANERQGHFGCVLFGQLGSLCLPGGGVVGLIDILYGEVLGVERVLEVRFEWCAHLADVIPVDAGKVWVLLDLRRTARTADVSNAVRAVTQQARAASDICHHEKVQTSPSDQVLGTGIEGLR